MLYEKDEPKTKRDYSGIIKITIYTIVCLTFGLVFANCGVSASDISECKLACGSRGMVSVSQWSCQCGWTSTSNDYVLPRIKSSK